MINKHLAGHHNQKLHAGQSPFFKNELLKVFEKRRFKPVKINPAPGGEGILVNAKEFDYTFSQEYDSDGSIIRMFVESNLKNQKKIGGQRIPGLSSRFSIPPASELTDSQAQELADILDITEELGRQVGVGRVLANDKFPFRLLAEKGYSVNRYDDPAMLDSFMSLVDNAHGYLSEKYDLKKPKLSEVADMGNRLFSSSLNGLTFEELLNTEYTDYPGVPLFEEYLSVFNLGYFGGYKRI